MEAEAWARWLQVKKTKGFQQHPESGSHRKDHPQQPSAEAQLSSVSYGHLSFQPQSYKRINYCCCEPHDLCQSVMPFMDNLYRLQHSLGCADRCMSESFWEEVTLNCVRGEGLGVIPRKGWEEVHVIKLWDSTRLWRSSWYPHPVCEVVLFQGFLSWFSLSLWVPIHVHSNVIFSKPWSLCMKSLLVVFRGFSQARQELWLLATGPGVSLPRPGSTGKIYWCNGEEPFHKTSFAFGKDPGSERRQGCKR